MTDPARMSDAELVAAVEGASSWIDSHVSPEVGDLVRELARRLTPVDQSNADAAREIIDRAIDRSDLFPLEARELKGSLGKLVQLADDIAAALDAKDRALQEARRLLRSDALDTNDPRPAPGEALMTATITKLAELREGVARALCKVGCGECFSCRETYEFLSYEGFIDQADAILALPEIAALFDPKRRERRIPKPVRIGAVQFQTGVTVGTVLDAIDRLMEAGALSTDTGEKP